MNNNRLKFLIFVLIMVGCIALGRAFHLDVEMLKSRLANYPLWLSGIIFVVLYVVTTTFVWFGPKDVFRVGSAFVFGATVSTIFVWIGELCNAAILFHLSRILGREYVESKFPVKKSQLGHVKTDSGFIGLLAMRINPLLPFRILDLSFGLSKVSFRKYFLATVIVSLPRIYWLQYIVAFIGPDLIKDPPAVISLLTENPFIIFYSVIYFLIVIVLSIIALIVKGVRTLKAKRNPQSEV